MSFAKMLRETYPYKTELHCHTFPCSSCATVSPEQIVRLYALDGYHSVVITNHLFFEGIKSSRSLEKAVDSQIADFERARAEGERVGLNVIFAAELRFDGSINDYLFYGPDPDFYKELDVKKIHTVEDFSRAYRNESNLLLQAHPFRTGMTLAPLELIDGIEAFNLNIRHNSRVGIASKYVEENRLYSICGTDFHHTGDGQLSAACTRQPVKTAGELVKIIRDGDLCWKIGNAYIVDNDA